MHTNLLSTSSRVQVPYIVVTIGDYTFGLFSKVKTTVEVGSTSYASVKTTYPNYMKSLVVTKVNGALNTYTLTIEYGITQNDDPNMFEKVFSSVSRSRKIKFTYGDCSTPAYMYREEEALITNIRTSLDTQNAKIVYTVTAVSGALKASAGTFSFPAYARRKPSDVIYELLGNKQYGLQEIFYGMDNLEKVSSLKLIRRDDAPVEIQAKSAITPWDYLGYLVTCMVPDSTVSGTLINSSRYTLTVHDDVSDVLSGPYFKIDLLETSLQSKSSVDYYTIDVGTESKDFISSFQVVNDESFAILYNYANEVQMSDYVYRIGDDGNVAEIFSPTLTNSKTQLRTTEVEKTWWTDMTQYPIKATLVIRGLLRAVMLMSYIRVNVYYYGRKHISSGVYVVTKQEDNVSTNGYFTTLSLLRVKGDLD